MFFMILAIGMILPPLLSGPAVLLEAPHPRASPWQFILGVACLGGFFGALVLGARKARSAECPVCRNALNKRTFTTHQCSRCGTRIIFDGESAPVDTSTAAAGAVAQKLVHGQGTAHHRTTITLPLHKERLADIGGFIAFPILFIWLWAGVEKRADQGGTVVITIMFLMVGAMYYFVPDSLGKKSRHSSKKTSEPEKPGPYLVDLSIVLSAPAVLLAYCLYLTWQHQTLGVKGLIGLVIGIPAGLVLVTYICKLRLPRDTKSFVPWVVFGLWLLGTFIWIVLVVWLLYKLRG